MNIEEKLKRFILEKFKSVRAFSIASDIPYSTINNLFERGIGNIGISTAISICDLLEIDVDALAHGEIQEKTYSYNGNLTSHEYALIEKYRVLDKYGIALVESVVELEFIRCADKAKAPEVPEEYFEAMKIAEKLEKGIDEKKSNKKVV